MTGIVIWFITVIAVGPAAFYSGYWFGRFAEARQSNNGWDALKDKTL